MITLEHGFEGPFRTGYWDAVSTNSGQRKRISGKQASMISLILSGYVFRDDFTPLDAFTPESLSAGRVNAKAVKRDVQSSPEIVAVAEVSPETPVA